VHLNKGRLHAFRKLSIDELPTDDCHFTLRRLLLQSVKYNIPSLALSVAWDWSFMGCDADGINREVLYSLECASINQRHNRQSLAVSESALLQWVLKLTSKKSSSFTSLIGYNSTNVPSAPDFDSKNVVHLAGLYAAAEDLLFRQLQIFSYVHQDISNTHKIAVVTKSDEHDLRIDPYENDFFCKLCHQELANAYFHCDGCDKLLDKDYNICGKCFSACSYQNLCKMHPNKKLLIHSTIHHTGHFTGDSTDCHGQACTSCKLCVGCSCSCHRSFILRYRFFDEDALNGMLKCLESEMMSKSLSLPSYEISKARLLVKENRFIEGLEAKRSILEKSGAAHFSITPSQPTTDTIEVGEVEEQSLRSAADKVEQQASQGSLDEVKDQESQPSMEEVLEGEVNEQPSRLSREEGSEQQSQWSMGQVEEQQSQLSLDVVKEHSSSRGDVDERLLQLSKEETDEQQSQSFPGDVEEQQSQSSTDQAEEQLIMVERETQSSRVEVNEPSPQWATDDAEEQPSPLGTTTPSHEYKTVGGIKILETEVMTECTEEERTYICIKFASRKCKTQ
jgi:hypothetical protein